MPHNHDEHGHDCSHEAVDVDNELEMGIEYSLYTKIDMENLECLNEESEGSGKIVFRPFEERLDFTKVMHIIWGYFFQYEFSSNWLILTCSSWKAMQTKNYCSTSRSPAILN